MQTLMDQPQILLRCFIFGDEASISRTFTIAVSPAATFEDVRKMIRQRNEQTFNEAHIDDRDLNLWKVSIPLTEMVAKLQDVRHLEAMDGIQILPPHQTISGHMAAFEASPPGDHLQVIVQPPVSSESQIHISYPRAQSRIAEMPNVNDTPLSFGGHLPFKRDYLDHHTVPRRHSTTLSIRPSNNSCEICP
jgi:hypothetical protein